MQIIHVDTKAVNMQSGEFVIWSRMYFLTVIGQHARHVAM